VSLIDLMPTILDAVNIPAPGSIRGRPCATPDELSREHAFGLSQPYSGDGKQRTYRSVRSADGWKLFGADRPDGDETLMTRYDSTTDGETLVHVTSGDSPPTDTAEVNRWTNLRGLLDSFGPPVEYGEPVGDESEQLESHLEDLGYM
jgi:arylsulfatase A-like enzyme